MGHLLPVGVGLGGRGFRLGRLGFRNGRALGRLFLGLGSGFRLGSLRLLALGLFVVKISHSGSPFQRC